MQLNVALFLHHCTQPGAVVRTQSTAFKQSSFRCLGFSCCLVSRSCSNVRGSKQDGTKCDLNDEVTKMSEEKI